MGSHVSTWDHKELDTTEQQQKNAIRQFLADKLGKTNRIYRNKNQKYDLQVCICHFEMHLYI